MPVVFVIAHDWNLRAMVRAELREKGIQAMGMESAAEAGACIASGTIPSVVVLEATQRVEPAMESLARGVPFVVVASAVELVDWPGATRLLHRPVRVGEIVAAVLEILEGCSA